MKRSLMIAAATIALAPAAHAQDKYGSSYERQTTTESRTTTSPQSFYNNRNTSTTTTSAGIDSNSPLTGFYVGAEGGYDWANLDSAVGDVDVDGWDYGIFAGYKIDSWLQNMGLGLTGAIEAHYDWSNADEDIAGATLEKDHEWGIDFRPGISISDTFNPYGIIGYERVQYEGTAGGFTGDESFDGFVLGAGTELMSWDRIGMRIDYTHTWYGEEGGIDPDEDAVKMGLLYRF